jgi:signal transduction histidine kinase
MAHDNTETVKAKMKLEELNRTLEKKVRSRTKELDNINKKLSEILVLKSKFISDASHELRTPLTVIQGNLDLAAREAKKNNKPIPETYQYAISEVERMSGILADLTMLTNIDSFNEALNYEKVDLGQLLKTIGQSLKVLADQKKIALIYKKGIKHLPVMGDEAKLEKLFLNIVRNAIKYTEPRGRVKIWLENGDNEGRAIIEDSGIGISGKDLPFIFERFYRVDRARSREEGGTGLGLSIAKWIADAHSGKISVESELGKGTRFIVHLPLDYKKQGLPSRLF